MVFEGNGSPYQGKIDIHNIGEDCTFFTRNPEKPPAEEELPNLITKVLQHWMLANPVRVRATLPIIADGRMIALFVWWDRVNPVLAKE